MTIFAYNNVSKKSPKIFDNYSVTLYINDKGNVSL